MKKAARSEGVIVIGGGHNGLVAAATLAKAGRKVTLVEARSALGGLAAPFSTATGARVPGLYEDTSLVRPWVLESLDITLPRTPRPTIVVPRADHADAELRLDLDKADGLSGAASIGDKAAWKAFRELVDELRPTLLGLTDRAPLSSEDSIWTLGRAAWSVRKLGKKTMMELVRVAPMCVADFVRDMFPSARDERDGATEHLRAAVAHGALEGAFTGPWSAHTALLLLLREVMSAGAVDAVALVDALIAANQKHGVTVRTEAKVDKILVGADGVRGVRLASGEELTAGVVLSTLDPKATFVEMIGPPWLPLEVAQSARVYRMRGTTGIAIFGLSSPLKTQAGTTVEHLRTGESLDQLEQAFDAAKYRHFAARPALSVRVYGGTVAVVRATAVPYDLEGGWTDASKAACLETILAQLERTCPKVRGQVTSMELLTPVDLEARFGLHGGHLLHGEHAPDQLLSFRPSLATGRYATPIDGLFIGGGASHPGGGLTGAPGALAARSILKS